MRESDASEASDEKGSACAELTGTPAPLGLRQVVILIFTCYPVCIAFLPLVWLGSFLIYLLGFKYLGSLSGLPMHWTLEIIEFWVILVAVIQLVLVVSLYIKVFDKVPWHSTFAQIIKRIPRALGKMLLAFFVLPPFIVAAVTVITFCTLYFLIPFGMKLGLPIRYDGQVMSLLCPMISLPQFIAAFAIQLWAYYPSMPKPVAT